MKNLWIVVGCLSLVLGPIRGVQANVGLRAELHQGYNPTWVARPAQVAELVAFLADPAESWETRLIVCYALESESLREQVKAGHEAAFESARKALQEVLVGVFDPARYPARDVLYRLQGIWLAGGDGPSRDEWLRGSFAAWLDHVDFDYALTLYDRTGNDEFKQRQDLAPAVKAALDEAMIERFPALEFYRWLGHVGGRTVELECRVVRAEVGADQVAEDTWYKMHRRALEVQMDALAKELIQEIEKTDRKIAELEKEADKNEPGYKVVKDVPYDWRKMTAKEWYRSKDAYERANANARTYTVEWGNRYYWNRICKEISSTRYHRLLLESNLRQHIAAQPTSVLEQVPYTRTTRSRICKAEGAATIRIKTRAGTPPLSDMGAVEQPSGLSWISTWTFAKTTWPARPEIGLEGSEGELRSPETCRQQTIEGCFSGAADFFARGAGQALYPWVARVHCAAEVDEQTRLEYRARALLTFFDPVSLRNKWRAEGTEGLDAFLAARRDLYLKSTGDPASLLRLAVREGDVALARQLLDSKAPVDKTESDKVTVLHHAARNGSAPIVRMLLDAGADPKARDQHGETPLYCAARSGNVEAAGMLIAAGAQVDAKNSDRETPLEAAAGRGSVEVGRLLIENGADPKLQSVDGCTLLHHAARSGNPDAVEFFLSRGIEVDATDAYKRTPLHEAADWGKAEAAIVLMGHGANVNAREERGGMTPLLLAADSGNEKLVAALVAKGANLSCLSISKRTALHWAARRGNAGLIDFLVAKGLDVSNRDEQGNTALHLAASMGNRDASESLLGHGADLTAKNNDGQSPIDLAISGKYKELGAYFTAIAPASEQARAWAATLHEALQDRQEESALELLRRGADILYRGNRGQTALHIAAVRDLEKMAQALIERGAPLDIQDWSGATPLFYATENGHKRIMKLLVAKGADLNLAYKDGETPLHRAIVHDRAGDVRFLLENGAELVPGKDGRRPLHYAAEARNVELVTLFLDRGADVSAADQKGYAPLHLTVDRGGYEVTKLLLDRGANLAATTSDGRTPLHLALRYGALDVAKLLLDRGADPRARDKNGDSTLHWYLYSSWPKVEGVKMLLAAGVSPNESGSDRRTPLHVAIEVQCNEAVAALLTAGADMYVPYNNSNWAAMHLALLRGNLEAMKLLKKAGYDLNRTDTDGHTVLWVAEQRKLGKAAQILRE